MTNSEASIGRSQEPQAVIGTEFDFGGVKERVVTRDDFSLDRARQVLKDETVAVIGYGVQGPAQALNLKDNGVNVIVGQRKGPAYDKAIADGWIPGRTLFSIEEAAQRGTQVQYLLSDAGQKELWPTIKERLKAGKTLYFSHGFSITYKDQTGVIPPKQVDTILVAPKGSGRSVRELFQQNRGINSSFAVLQSTERARDRVLATGMAIGSGFLFPTTFKEEVFSDLTGERGVLMGAVYGLWQAAYNSLRSRSLTPKGAIAHTVEISTQTISRIIGEKGADGLIKDLPTDLLPYFSTSLVFAYEAANPVFEDLYTKVATGVETRRTLEANSKPDYRDKLNDELRAIAQSELGRAGTAVRELRTKNPVVPTQIQNQLDAIMAGSLVGLFHSQYDLFRKKGHKPSEAFNETSEEATQSLYPLIHRQGIDWMYANCSTTAQRGALDWNGAFRDALQPELQKLYSGQAILITYQSVLDNIRTSEMWKAGATVRNLRPENQGLTV